MSLSKIHNKNLNKFNDLLEKCNIKKPDNVGKKITHTRMGSPFGSFSIIGKDYTKFIDIYKKVFPFVQDHGFVERPDEFGPNIIDIDYKVGPENKDRLYTKEHVKKVVDIHNKIFKKYFKVTDEELHAWIMEKDKPTPEKDGERYKDGFHIIYPFIISHVKHRYLVYEMAKKEMEKNNPFDDIPTETPIDDILDKCVVDRNGILMHGSAKPGRKPYTLAMVLDSDLDELDISEFTDSEIIDTIKSRGNSKKNAVNIKSKFKKSDIVDEIYEMYTNPIKKTKVNEKVDVKRPDRGRIIVGDKKEVEMAKKLADILSPSRSESYNSWISVGWALHNIDHSLLDTFKKFSQKCPGKYDANSCDRVWRDAKDYGFTIASLKWWARSDNPEGYNNVMYEESRKLLDRARSGTHDDMANLLCFLYKDICVCSNIGKNTWYEFMESRWVKVDSAYTIHAKISNDVTDLIYKYHDSIMAKARAAKSKANERSDADSYDSDDDKAEERFINKAKNFLRLIEKVKSNTFQNSVIKQAAHKFYVPKFETMLDDNKYILAFDNGVYELKKGLFRDTVPTDYVSKTTGYNYLEFSKDSKEVKFVRDFFKKVHTNKNVREYTLTLFASCCDGYQKQHRLPIFTGEGSNSKSTVIKFCSHAFGEYYGTIPITILTQKLPPPNAPNPFMSDKRGTRMITLSEPAPGETINVSQAKDITGADLICARALFGDPIYFVPQFMIFLICNGIPRMPKGTESDGGVKRRMRIIEHTSCFVETDEEIIGDNYFLGDPDIEEKIEKIENRQAFMWLLLNEYYPKYQSEGLVEPKEVMMSTVQYRNSNDIYFQFIDAEIEITNDNTDMLSLDTMYEAFKAWYLSAYSSKAPPKPEFIQYLKNNKSYKIDKSRYFVGAKLTNIDE